MELERGAAAAAEDAAGRFEALSAALGAAVTLREELARRDAVINALHHEVVSLREAVSGKDISLAAELYYPLLALLILTFQRPQ